MKPQDTVDEDGNPTVLTGRGRHDPCVVPRAVPIVEAMMALVLVDHLLRQRAQVGPGGVVAELSWLKNMGGAALQPQFPRVLDPQQRIGDATPRSPCGCVSG